jgi:hypothetical protein
VTVVRTPVADRLELHVIKGDGPDACWGWKGATANGGYGKLGSYDENGKPITVRAHVVSYEKHVGPVPDGMWVLHSCDNPPCCNPKHLFPGTPLDNTKDMHAKGRAAVREKHPRTKLTVYQAEQIRRMCAETPLLQREIGKKFGVDQSNVSAIHHKKIWA